MTSVQTKNLKQTSDETKAVTDYCTKIALTLFLTLILFLIITLNLNRNPNLDPYPNPNLKPNLNLIPNPNHIPNSMFSHTLDIMHSDSGTAGEVFSHTLAG